MPPSRPPTPPPIPIDYGEEQPPPICVDSGDGPYADLDGLAPYYLAKRNHSARVIDANPQGIVFFDSFFWALLSVFVVWAGVGWTTMQYLVSDAQGRGFEVLFMLMHTAGAWFLINLVVAVMGAAFEREQAKQRLRREAIRRAKEETEKNRPDWAEAAGRTWLSLKNLPARWAAAEARAKKKIDAQRQQDALGIRKVVDSTYFNVFIMIIIFSATICTSVDGPFIKEEFGMGSSQRMVAMLNLFFGVVYLLEGSLKSE